MRCFSFTSAGLVSPSPFRLLFFAFPFLCLFFAEGLSPALSLFRLAARRRSNKIDVMSLARLWGKVLTLKLMAQKDFFPTFDAVAVVVRVGVMR